MQKAKTKYKAFSKLRRDWIYVWAFSKAQAKVLIRRRIKAAIGRYDNDYEVVEAD